ncbi:hypothetical protein ACWDOP_14645 [Nocardia sp. NPDC003693]
MTSTPEPLPAAAAGPAPKPIIIKVLLVVICTLVSMLAAFIGAALVRHTGSSWAATFYAGGGVFAGALTLTLFLLNTLWHD